MSPPPDEPGRPSRAPLLAPKGDLAMIPPDVVLRFCEHVRFSGTLAFEGDGRRGVLPMLNGVPEIVPDNPRLERALDDLLVLENGRYTLTQLLPMLPGAASVGDRELQGSLETSSVADLLRYCERAGLTGHLTLRRDDDECIVRYDRGEMVSMVVPRSSSPDVGEQDLSGVFAWARGTFGVRAKSVFDRDRKVTEPHQAAFLKSLEMALVDVVDRSEKVAAVAHPLRAPAAGPSILRGSTLPFGLDETGAQLDDDAPTPSPLDPFPTSEPVKLPPPPAPPVIPRVPALPGHPAALPRAVPPPVRPRTEPPPPPGPETTVKIYFVDRGDDLRPSGTQHVAAKLGSEVIPLEPGSSSRGLPALSADDAAATILRARPATTEFDDSAQTVLRERPSVTQPDADDRAKTTVRERPQEEPRETDDRAKTTLRERTGDTATVDDRAKTTVRERPQEEPRETDDRAKTTVREPVTARDTAPTPLRTPPASSASIDRVLTAVFALVLAGCVVGGLAVLIALIR